MKRCTLFFLLFLTGCSQKENHVQRSFYFWKSNFQLSQNESDILDSLGVKKLYVKFFDVEWNGSALPVAQVQFTEKPALPVIPVVFITNETLERLEETDVEQLAKKIMTLVSDLANLNKLNLFPEFQLDCDWTRQTREKFFRLIQYIRKNSFIRGKKLSATIRLHQLKFLNQTGVPPVDRGMLMCYNMGNLKQPGIKNSILDINEMKKYTSHLNKSPLPLDVGLPLFDWYVWFRQGKFKGLIQSQDLPGLQAIRTSFQHDTLINGRQFARGDWIRHEASRIEDLQSAARIIEKNISSTNFTVVLYHLDQYYLNKFSNYELEDIFHRFE